MPAARHTYFCSCYRKCGGTPTEVTRAVYRSHTTARLEMDGLPSKVPRHRLVNADIPAQIERETSCIDEKDADVDDEEREGVTEDNEIGSSSSEQHQERFSSPSEWDLGNIFDRQVVDFFWPSGAAANQIIRMMILMVFLRSSNKTSRERIRVEMVPVQLLRLSQMKMIPSMSHLPLMLMKRFLKTRCTRMSRLTTFDAPLPISLLCKVLP